MNTGRSFELKWAFCKENRSKAIMTPEWLCGFSDGEGCFQFYINDKEKSPILRASFSIGQNTHDVFVLEKIQEF